MEDISDKLLIIKILSAMPESRRRWLKIALISLLEVLMSVSIIIIIRQQISAMVLFFLTVMIVMSKAAI